MTAGHTLALKFTIFIRNNLDDVDEKSMSAHATEQRQCSGVCYGMDDDWLTVPGRSRS
jgi:hypothetical protein